MAAAHERILGEFLSCPGRFPAHLSRSLFCSLCYLNIRVSSEGRREIDLKEMLPRMPDAESLPNLGSPPIFDKKRQPTCSER